MELEDGRIPLPNGAQNSGFYSKAVISEIRENWAKYGHF
jgi:hypothetical protein